MSFQFRVKFADFILRDKRLRIGPHSSRPERFNQKLSIYERRLDQYPIKITLARLEISGHFGILLAERERTHQRHNFVIFFGQAKKKFRQRVDSLNAQIQVEERIPEGD